MAPIKETLEPTNGDEGRDFRERLLVSPPQKPNIGPVSINTSLLSRLDAFLQDADKAPAERLELEDADCKHIELDMSCGVFELKDDGAVRAAEAAVGGMSAYSTEAGDDKDALREKRLVEVVDEALH